MDVVNDCPRNLTEIAEASKRLGCKNDIYGNNQYICVPNVNLTSLVEFCNVGIMGIHKENHCIAASGKSLLDVSCLNFSSGCPDRHHWSSEFYKYPECQNINTQHHCYVKDPSCPHGVSAEASDGTINQTWIVLPVGLVLLAVAFLIYWMVQKKCSGESSNELKTHDKKSTESPKQIKRDDKKSAGSLSSFISSIESVFTNKKAKEDFERDYESNLIRKETPKEIKRDDKRSA